MRNRLIHDYIGVNYSIVWEVFKNKIPELNEQIHDVLKKESFILATENYLVFQLFILDFTFYN